MPEARGFCRTKAAARLVVMLCSPQPPEGSIIETDQTLTREVTLFMNISVLLFDGFEALDAFGPVEVFSKAGGWNIGFYSFTGGIVTCAQGIKVQTEPFSSADKSGVLLVPGGMGTRRLVGDAAFLEQLKSAADKASYCLSVCTGSALLARCGVLDGRHATSNKRAMTWVKEQGPDVLWENRARWVADGKFFTSSGISAGIDMALDFVRARLGEPAALEIAERMEYLWNSESTNDPYARD
jgi:putative intracellular protease/amidase